MDSLFAAENYFSRGDPFSNFFAHVQVRRAKPLKLLAGTGGVPNEPRIFLSIDFGVFGNHALAH
jgi:hypothetical protein